jgi:transcriptional regulator with XRE-family HTH domain
MMQHKIIRSRLREERILKGLSRDYIERACGLSHDVLVSYETNKTEPTVSTAIMIAQAMGSRVEKIWSVEIVDEYPENKEVWDL